MGLKRISLPIPLEQFKNFKEGKTIVVSLPADCELQVGDRVMYDCGQTIYGAAETVSVDRALASGEFRMIN